MAVVIIGGLVASTLLVLLVIPALYRRFGDTDLRSIWDDELFASEDAVLGVGIGAGSEGEG